MEIAATEPIVQRIVEAHGLYPSGNRIGTQIVKYSAFDKAPVRLSQTLSNKGTCGDSQKVD